MANKDQTMKSQDKSKSAKKDGDTAEILRRIYERNLDGHVVSKKLLNISIIGYLAGVVGMAVCVYAVLFHPIKHVYIGVTKNMTIMQIIPLKRAYYADSTVGNFAVKGLIKAFNFSYINRKYHFRGLVNEGFSEEGLSNLISSMQNSGIMNRIIKDKLFVRFAVTSAPFIVQKGIVVNPFTRQPTYQWVVQFQGVMTYTNGTDEATKTNDYNVTVTRVSSLESGDALRIRSVVAKNVSTNQSGAEE